MPSATSAKGRWPGAEETSRKGFAAIKEQAFLAEQPQPIEEILFGIRIRPGSRRAADNSAGSASRRRRRSITRPCSAVAADKNAPSRGRRTEEFAHQGDQFAVLDEQGEISRPAALQRPEDAGRRPGPLSGSSAWGQAAINAGTNDKGVLASNTT